MPYPSENESASAEGGEMLLAESAGKYDVSRQLQGGGSLEALLGAGEYVVSNSAPAPGVRMLPGDVEAA